MSSGYFEAKSTEFANAYAIILFIVATEFDPRRNIPPPDGAELTPEEEAQHKIREYLKDAEFESPRFQAFADFTDRQYAGFFHTQDPEMIKETIRQRINGFKGYKREYEHITRIVLDYHGNIASNKMSEVEELKEKQLFFIGLMKIKDQETDRKSRES